MKECKATLKDIRKQTQTLQTIREDPFFCTIVWEEPLTGASIGFHPDCVSTLLMLLSPSHQKHSLVTCLRLQNH